MGNSQHQLTDEKGNPVKLVEAYLCSDHVLVRTQSGTTKVMKTGDLKRK